MPNLNDTYASVLAAYSGSVNDKRSARLTEYLGYAKPLSLNDMEKAALAALGYTGALNDAWDKYLKAIGGFGLSQKADYLSSTFYGYSVLSMFAASEPGFWYDPSDRTTLFVDNVGTTPVTAVGQTVGLMLDKSQGTALGPELATNLAAYPNGTAISTVPNWLLNSTPVVADIQNGALRVTADSSGDGARFTFTTVAGRSYQITFTYSGTGSSNVFINGPSLTFSANRVIFVATGSSESIFFRPNGNNGSGTGTWSNISIKLVPGNHAKQNTSTQRPIYQIDSTGRPYLLFDGIDDGMLTGTITPATDKVQVFAGLRKLSDSAQQLVVELSASITLNLGSFALTAPNSAAANYNFSSKGLLQTDNVVTTYTAPLTNVVTGLGDIAGASNLIRVDGGQVGSTLTTQGTGNYLAYPIYIGRRGGATAPYNGRLYSLIVRFGSNLPSNQIAATESFVKSKTGVY